MRFGALKVVLVLFVMSSSAWSADSDLQDKAKDLLQKTQDAAEQAVDSIQKSASESRQMRDNFSYFAYLNYAPVDLLIPSKTGLTLGYQSDASESWEFEYLSGSVAVPFVVKDLGKMEDKRYSLIKRVYGERDSFYLSYGLSYFSFSLHLGDKLLNKVTGGQYPSIDLVELEAVGAHVGMGNRWTFKKRFSLGVEWLAWSQPLFVTKRKSAFLDYATDQSDKDDVDKALSTIQYFPRFSVFKVQLGMSF